MRVKCCFQNFFKKAPPVAELFALEIVLLSADVLAEEGKLAEISTKWFGSDITLIGKK